MRGNVSALYFVIVRSRTKVYCDDSRVNVEINRSVKYEWSRCMLLHSGMAAILVKTQDKTYLFNDESEAGTRELYDRLVEACGNGVQ